MILESTSTECINRIREILAYARASALQSVNTAMVAAYWEIGREIVEEEQRGKERADYGIHLIKQLSKRLTADFGRGFSVANLKLFRQFYKNYRDRLPKRRYSVSSQLTAGKGNEIGYSVSSQLTETEADLLNPDLSWTHYRVLIRVSDLKARSFYEVECAKTNWSVRELERQINSKLFERLALSRDKEGIMALAQEGHEVHKPADLVLDPYVLEFTGLPERSHFHESDLEQALIDKLQQFLLELGRDLFFVARQKRITIEGDHFRVDLVFYHRILRCFLLIDLKLTRLTQQDIGQMMLYCGYYEQEERREDENPPIGLILCADKNESVVRYTLSQSASQIFASRYQLHLPSEEALAKELQRERYLLENRQRDDGSEEGSES